MAQDPNQEAVRLAATAVSYSEQRKSVEVSLSEVLKNRLDSTGNKELSIQQQLVKYAQMRYSIALQTADLDINTTNSLIQLNQQLGSVSAQISDMSMNAASISQVAASGASSIGSSGGGRVDLTGLTMSFSSLSATVNGYMSQFGQVMSAELSITQQSTRLISYMGTGIDKIDSNTDQLEELAAETTDAIETAADEDANRETEKKSKLEKAVDAVTKIFTGGWIQEIIITVVNTLEAIRESVVKSAEAVSGKLTSSVSSVDSRLYGLMTQVDGLNVNYVDLGNDIIALVSETGSMAMLNEEKIIDNMVGLINQGIAFNIEQRALWMTMTDKLVSTFSVTNETLLGLVKLQQEELTDTYMGIEASITRTLNSMFKDTQYLSNGYDTVWNNLSDALANVSSDLGAEIAYQVQLWLGSLSSVGLSNTAAGSMATAINALLTGNINSLGDSGRTLLAMAAANSNMSFADLLVNGVSSGSQMNSLMSGIVSVLQNIYSESKDNNVLLSEWGKILSLSISDWKALSNLQQSDIETLVSLADYTRADAVNELNYIADNLVSERTLIQERFDNLLANLKFEAGWNYATSDFWMTWTNISKILNTVLSSAATGSSGTAGSALLNYLYDTNTSDWTSFLANTVGIIGDVGEVVGSVAAGLDPFLDFFGSFGGLWGRESYANFNNTSVNGKLGAFAAELFSYMLQDQGYIDYGNIKNQSHYETTSSVNKIAGIGSGIEYEGYAQVAPISSNATANKNATTFTGTTATGSAVTGAEAGTITGTTGQGTIGSAASNPANSEVINSIDDLYTLLSTKPGAYVTVAGLDSAVLESIRSLFGNSATMTAQFQTTINGVTA